MVSEVASFSHDDSHKHDDQTDVMIDALDFALVTPPPKAKPKAVFGTYG